MLDGVCWFEVTNHNKPGALVPAVLPQGDAKNTIRKALNSPGLFVVRPGATVKVDASGIKDPGERERIEADFTKKRGQRLPSRPRWDCAANRYH